MISLQSSGNQALVLKAEQYSLFCCALVKLAETSEEKPLWCLECVKTWLTLDDDASENLHPSAGWVKFQFHFICSEQLLTPDQKYI